MADKPKPEIKLNEKQRKKLEKQLAAKELELKVLLPPLFMTRNL